VYGLFCNDAQLNSASRVLMLGDAKTEYELSSLTCEMTPSKQGGGEHYLLKAARRRK
jgi:hypothetical protein